MIVVDESAIFRAGVCAILARDEAFTVQGEVATWREVLTLSYKIPPDLLIVGLRLPWVNGLNALAHLTCISDHPPVLILSGNLCPSVTRAALGAGVAGYVTEDTSPSVFLAAAQRIANNKNQPPILIGIAHTLESVDVALSVREISVLMYVADGLTNNAIADHLNVSVRTVETYLSRVYHKLNVKTRYEAVVAAYHSRIIPRDDSGSPAKKPSVSNVRMSCSPGKGLFPTFDAEGLPGIGSDVL
ncbi:MAG TPA: response regulator transcription factor [Ktedonobacterales bacterium]|nr:response regulator transcription factor [Ktedonobacterales bacterium]